MSYSIRVLSRPEISAGFALAGLHPIEAVSVGEASERLRELRATPDVGVVLIEEDFYDHLPEELRRQLGREPLPLVVPFPEPAWVGKPEAADVYIVDLLRQVIGYRVRLR